MSKLKWKPMETAPKDGREVLCRVFVAGVEIVRNAHYDDGQLWDMQGCDSQDEASGWWFYENSVSQSKMEDYLTPTEWAEM